MIKNILLLLIPLLLFVSSTDAQTFQAFLNAGEDAMEQGDFFSAQTYFQRALEFDANHLPSNYKLAQAYYQTNDLSNAAVYFRRVLELDTGKNFPEASKQLALIEMKLENYEVALNQLELYDAQNKDGSSEEIEDAIANCKFAIENIKTPVDAKISNIGEDLNSPYSDFSPQLIGDDELYYSSLRFLGKFDKPKTESQISKILYTSRSAKGWKSPRELPSSINRPDSHNCNSMISADGNLMVFTRCNYNDENKLICDIYESRKERNSWSSPVRLPLSVNSRGSSNTHPFLAPDGAQGYRLFFVSDREDGFGSTDLYVSERSVTGVYSNPVNLGKTINTDGSEVSPAFDSKNLILYFSSNGMTGFGGYDVFSATFKDGAFEPAKNMGYLINSGLDDLYFRPDLSGERFVFASNRVESQFITSSSCCYDLYYGEYKEPEPVTIDSSVVTVTKTLNRIEQYLPLQLYFHNDEPNPKSLDTVTKETYLETYKRYIEMQDTYRKRYQGNEVVTTNPIDSFFDNHVRQGYHHLDTVILILADQIERGKTIMLKIRGHCSPLAPSDYNLNLAKRRISSLLNYIRSFDNFRFEEAVSNGRLILEEIPAGEDLARENVSDDYGDQRNSVYSPEAAQERRIEIRAVLIE